MEKLKEMVRLKSTQEIFDATVLIGGGHVAQDVRMVRAALIDVYAEREGLAAADTLMDLIDL